MITVSQILDMFEVLESTGLRPPDIYSRPAARGAPSGRAFAAGVYVAAFAQGGYTWPEIQAAALEYALEPQAEHFPKPWPSPGHVVARTQVARTAALLGSDDEGEASWSHMHRRMAFLGFAPDRDAPSRQLHPADPAKNDALFTALTRFGGAERWREMPTQDANPAGYGAAKKSWIACFTAARREQGNNPTTVRQMVAASQRQIEASK